jgi:hypothetical protein
MHSVFTNDNEESLAACPNGNQPDLSKISHIVFSTNIKSFYFYRFFFE